jgi:tetratricopeptide (TPR) repeat protein
MAVWSIQARAGDGALAAGDWQADLDFVIEQIVTRHPHAFGRTGEWEFRAAARDLRREIPQLAPEAIVVRLAALVARLEDGHTSLEPYVGEGAPGGFETWFPIRFRQFTDGLFVTMAPAEHPELIGSEVLRLGETQAEEALRRAATMVPAENEHWVMVNAPEHLSSGEALVGLGILDQADALPLTVRTQSGAERTVVLAGIVAPQSSAWFWRWLRGPVGTETVHGFAELPLHLAQQVGGAPSYDFTYVPASKTLYLHLIGFWDAGEEDLLAFWDRAWKFYETHDVERFIFDLRVNGGGNGARVTPIVHSFIRHAELEEPGRLFVLTGGKTFSAAVMMVAAMEQHTAATIVGTPMGAAYIQHGDAGTVRLPASGLELSVSTLYHQLSRSDDDRREVSPHVPAPVSSVDYYAGRDPALEAITSGAALRIVDHFRIHGARRALATLDDWRDRYAALTWWQPFAERELNTAGYDLLRQGRYADAQAAFQLNAETFPESGNVWDSLAESYLQAGDETAARRYYLKALEVDPSNGNAAAQIEALSAPD